MSNFTARKAAPNTNSKFYYSDNIFYRSGYGMPNCTCYAWGRWYELLGSKPKLYTGNANTWYPKGTNYDGYARGNTPKLGAIACWTNRGAGHVSVVEEIYSDGSILTSNSAWKSTNFYTKKIAKGYAINGYTFQGFIYPPVNFTSGNTNSNSNSNTNTNEIVYTVVAGDNLTKIANRYGTTYQKLAEYNGIANPNIIGIGQKIKIPSGSAAVNNAIKVGDLVRPTKNVSYNGVSLASKVLNNNYTVIDLKGKRAVLGNGLNTAFNVDNLKKM